MLICNAVDAEGRKIDLLLRDGKIFAQGADLKAMAAPDEELLDASGLTVLPGFVDLHTHWRTPGFTYKEDLHTGSMAAAAGGYTFCNLMPNTKPVCSDGKLAHEIQDEVEKIGLCRCNQTVSITQNFDGATLDHLKTLPEDVKFITEDGHGVQSASVMAKAFAIAQKRGLTVMSHAEDMEVSPWDYRLAENLETVRNLHLCEYYGTRLHLCHVSTKEAMAAILESKQKGAPVTCEVMPHHIWFTGDEVSYKVNPPLRAAEDVEFLCQAIEAGLVDAIATDHAPHSEEDKLKGAAGMVGLETAFSLCYTKLCLQRGLPLAVLSRLMSENPARLLGMTDCGSLKPGNRADIVLVDLNKTYTIRNAALHSKSKNSPFDGVTVCGKVEYTLLGGKLVWNAEQNAFGA